MLKRPQRDPAIDVQVHEAADALRTNGRLLREIGAIQAQIQGAVPERRTTPRSRSSSSRSAS